MSTIKDRLPAYMERRGLPLEAMANKLDVPPKTLERYLAGHPIKPVIRFKLRKRFSDLEGTGLGQETTITYKQALETLPTPILEKVSSIVETKPRSLSEREKADALRSQIRAIRAATGTSLATLLAQIGITMGQFYGPGQTQTMTKETKAKVQAFLDQQVTSAPKEEPLTASVSLVLPGATDPFLEVAALWEERRSLETRLSEVNAQLAQHLDSAQALLDRLRGDLAPRKELTP